MKGFFCLLITGLISLSNQGWGKEYLIKLNNNKGLGSEGMIQLLQEQGVQVAKFNLLKNWLKITTDEKTNLIEFEQSLKGMPGVEYVQPNYPISLQNDFKIQDPEKRKRLIEALKENKNFPGGTPPKDNPPIPAAPTQNRSGADPLLNRQWGMGDIQAGQAWQATRGSKEMIVAVIDTGVDYTHEDLIENMWRNPGETGTDENGKDKSSNGIDDDGNGYIDDVVGYDFAKNDNLPYDHTLSLMDIVLKGGNPGHGTHCAGNVAARGNNGKGISGVAPNVKIMALRFLTEKGQGKTDGAIKSIEYAIKNGAKILSNSWGSAGEDPKNPAGNKALKEAIEMAQEKGRIFVAAAGNGRQGKGYNNDSDSKPSYPASYPFDIIISVAALDSSDQLGKFSNWGQSTVDLGAPGVKVFSTVPGNKYTDTVLNTFGIKVFWDGTSMATPHVAGALALYWSKYPEKDWREVKKALLNSAKPINPLNGKTSTGGKLNASMLLNE